MHKYLSQFGFRPKQSQKQWPGWSIDLRPDVRIVGFEERGKSEWHRKGGKPIWLCSCVVDNPGLTLQIPIHFYEEICQFLLTVLSIECLSDHLKRSRGNVGSRECERKGKAFIHWLPSPISGEFSRIFLSDLQENLGQKKERMSTVRDSSREESSLELMSEVERDISYTHPRVLSKHV